jgi:aminodeoxyfutalosine synthase
MTASSSSASLGSIAKKVEAGRRLSHEDGVCLYRSRDVHEIGWLANLVRERLHGDAAFYNINRHINYTNYCVLRCKFCSFYRVYAKGGHGGAQPSAAEAVQGSDLSTVTEARGGSNGAYALSVEQIRQQAREAYEAGATEVHIVGGLHPTLPFSYYVEVCEAIREACPRIHIKAFTAVEIIHFTRISKPRLTIGQCLERLRAAGLDSLPGGGAEIFDDRVHDEAHRSKVGEAGWFDVHRVAHELGIPTNATMLYGHIEGPEERITHMIKLREHAEASLRERKAAFNCFVPLSFIPEGSALGHLPGPTGLDDLKTLAISRLMLDNIPHVKAFWPMHSPKLAQVALNWGVDDFDGTVVRYDITQREGGSGNRRQEMTVEQIRRLICEAGRRPVERDTLYRRVERDGADWRVVERV